MDDLKEKKLAAYEAALIRIRDQVASPSSGTDAWNNWLHWMTIAENVLKEFEE